MEDKDSLIDVIEKLDKVKGRHTELVTFYIPAGANLYASINQLKQEQSTAQNIKSKPVRKNVMAALEKILQHLRAYKKTPENGLALFCGNVSEKEGEADIQIWSIEPLEPLKNALYRCDQTFVLGQLKNMVREREIYGLIVLDKSEADIGLLKGTEIEPLKHMESIVPGKSKPGGWSQARFQRIREGMLHDFLKKVGDIVTAKFKDVEDLKGVIIGGPGPVKEQFLEGEFLNYMIKKMVLGLVNTNYTAEFGLKETVERSHELISQAKIIKEQKILDRFFENLAKDTGLAVYGKDAVMKAMSQGAVDTVIVSEYFEKHEDSQITEQIKKTAEQMSSKIEKVSVNTQRGIQLKELGGIGAILRYKLS